LRIKFLSAALGAAIAIVAARAPAQAIPLFAQRYQLQCSACHSVLPELNAFGNSFRAHGYQLPLPKHGTTGIALRYQMEWERDPAAGSPRFTPGGVLLSNADIGAVSAFVHYNLGAGGGPSGLFLGYLATYNAHTQSLYRAGLFELPLAQSPGQRLDDLAPYGYYGAHVGLNDLSLSSPRWGAQAERTIGSAVADLIVDFGEFKGSAYGGKPVPTGETTGANSPEIGMFLRAPLTSELQVGGDFITGSRRIVPAGRNTFTDSYQREGVFAKFSVRNVDLQAEQWWGNDANSDGFGSHTGSTGGYVRLKYYVTPHAYLGIRYDAQAVPFITRDVVYYAAFHVTPHARLLIQQVQPTGGTPHLGAALTVGFPWPAHL
jgi:mono/diheme cytochrome c family protein